MRATFLFILFAFMVLSQSVKIKMIHTTDVHGWIFQHRHNATLDADFGDFGSLVTHMRESATLKNENFFLFDSGDQMEGTGLSDATPTQGFYIYPVFQKLNFDGLTIGNHELGRELTLKYLRDDIIPTLGGSYITSNTFWKDTSSPYFGAPYKFIKSKGVNLLVLGYIYIYNPNSITVTTEPIDSISNDANIINAMKNSEIDAMVFLCHINPEEPENSNDIKKLYYHVRSIYPNVALIFLAGHRHVKYYERYDQNAFVIESGRYFETIGYLEIDIVGKQLTNVAHQWFSPTLNTMYQLSGKTKDTFPTKLGTDLKKYMSDAYNTLHLNDTMGCALYTYCPYSPVSDKRGLFNLYIERVIPDMVFKTPTRNSTNIYISNNSALRSCLYAGVVNYDDILSIIPFAEYFYHLENVNGKQLRTLLSTTSRYRYSLIQIKDDDHYDVICSEYDCNQAVQRLKELFPTFQWEKSSYLQISSTEILKNWVKNHFFCK